MELEQILLVLPFGHLERLVYNIIILLKSRQRVELQSRQRVAVMVMKTHQNQVRSIFSLLCFRMSHDDMITLYLSDQSLVTNQS
jgi:hypothetical protein